MPNGPLVARNHANMAHRLPRSDKNACSAGGAYSADFGRSVRAIPATDSDAKRPPLPRRSGRPSERRDVGVQCGGLRENPSSPASTTLTGNVRRSPSKTTSIFRLGRVISTRGDRCSPSVVDLARRTHYCVTYQIDLYFSIVFLSQERVSFLICLFLSPAHSLFSHGLTLEFDLVGVVDHSIKDRIGQRRIVEILVPLADRQLTHDKSRAVPVPVIEDLQEIAAAFGTQR